MSLRKFVQNHRIASAAVLVLVVMGSAVVAATSAKRISPLSWGWYGSVHAPVGLAIDGYDAVAYHTLGAAMPGAREHTTTWHGVTWRFISDTHRAAFESAPDKYAPQFGGFCSYAASKGFTAKTDPTAWRVEDGKLYLFNDTTMRDNWVSELEDGVVGRGEQAWAERPHP